MDLTNILANASREYSMQQAVVSSENMVTVAKSAQATYPNIQRVVLIQTVDRYDNKHDLNNYVQQKLDEANKRANDSRIMIGKHNLECDGAIRASRFGDSRTKRADGVHLRALRYILGISGRMFVKIYRPIVSCHFSPGNLISRGRGVGGCSSDISDCLRGNSGMMSYTRRVANILVVAGLASEEEAALVGRNKNISFKKKNKKRQGPQAS